MSTRLPQESFPDALAVRFVHSEELDRVITFVDGQQVGDPLSDNSYQPDYYRFHDVFHFTFMTFLDWSPCIRHLLKRKRKSNPLVDEVEDGARARSIEEGLSAILFEEASQQGFFEHVPVSDETLRVILQSVRRLEVKDKTVEEWRTAISQGFLAFRYLVAHQGGEILFDRKNRAMSFRACA